MSGRALLDTKHRATVAMAAARDRVISRARVVAETAYSTAHEALILCTNDDQVEIIERAFARGMIELRRSIDVHHN